MEALWEASESMRASLHVGKQMLDDRLLLNPICDLITETVMKQCIVIITSCCSLLRDLPHKRERHSRIQLGAATQLLHWTGLPLLKVGQHWPALWSSPAPFLLLKKNNNNNKQTIKTGTESYWPAATHQYHYAGKVCLFSHSPLELSQTEKITLQDQQCIFLLFYFNT